MLKTKWFKVSTDLPLDEIIRHFQNTPYLDERNYGFDVIEVFPSSSLVKYTEKNVVNELVTLPSGEQETVKFDRYTSFYFELIKAESGKFFIKVETPPRSLRSFQNSISHIGSQQLYFGNITINVDKFVQKLVEKYDVSRLLISKATIDKVAISGVSQARLEMTSSQNAYQDFIDKFGGRDHTLLKVVASFILEGRMIKLEVTRNGLLCVDENIDTMTLSQLISAAS